jgi:hypothetical protein
LFASDIPFAERWPSGRRRRPDKALALTRGSRIRIPPAVRTNRERRTAHLRFLSKPRAWWMSTHAEARRLRRRRAPDGRLVDLLIMRPSGSTRPRCLTLKPMGPGWGGFFRKHHGRRWKRRSSHRKKALLIRLLPAFGRRIMLLLAPPVTPEVAGSSPVAPVFPPRPVGPTGSRAGTAREE